MKGIILSIVGTATAAAGAGYEILKPLQDQLAAQRVHIEQLELQRANVAKAAGELHTAMADLDKALKVGPDDAQRSK